MKAFKIALIALILILAFGCVPKQKLNDTKDDLSGITGDVVLEPEEETEDETPVDELPPEEPPYEPPVFLHNGSGSGSDDDGEGIVCEPPSEMRNGVCKTPECVTDEDCKDEDPCTIDTCAFAGNVNAFCPHDLIKRYIPNDECCPYDGTVDKDIDCKPVCGDQKCEYGEFYETCKVDCPETGGEERRPPRDEN